MLAIPWHDYKVLLVQNVLLKCLIFYPQSRNHAISNYQQPFLQITQPTVQTVAAAHLKDSNRINQSPGSPIISSQNTKEQFQSLSHVQTSNSSQISPSSVSPVPLQPSPVVNLQALAKYVDKSLTNHTINWPTEAMDKQVLITLINVSSSLLITVIIEALLEVHSSVCIVLYQELADFFHLFLFKNSHKNIGHLW